MVLRLPSFWLLDNLFHLKSLFRYYPMLFNFTIVHKICLLWSITHDRAWYDILAMCLPLFLCNWRQIRWELEELWMILGTYILYCFHSSRCNSVLFVIMQLHRCFKCFVVRNHVNHQIKTSCEGSTIKNWR